MHLLSIKPQLADTALPWDMSALQGEVFMDLAWSKCLLWILSELIEDHLLLIFVGNQFTAGCTNTGCFQVT